MYGVPDNNTTLHRRAFIIDSYISVDTDCELVFNDECPPNKFGIYVSGDWLALNEIGITDHEGKAILRGYYYRNMFKRLNQSLHGSCFDSCQLFLGIYDSKMLEFFPV